MKRRRPLRRAVGHWSARTAGSHGAAQGRTSVQDAWAQTEVSEQARGVQADLGCGLHPQRSGRGYAPEAVSKVLRICCEELGLRRVTADCLADNTASWRLMERVGMRREAYTVQDSAHRSGAGLDGMAYALLQEEWVATR